MLFSIVKIKGDSNSITDVLLRSFSPHRVKNVNSPRGSEDLIKVCQRRVSNICTGVWKICRVIPTTALPVLFSDSLLILSEFHSLNSNNSNIALRHITNFLPLLLFEFHKLPAIGDVSICTDK